MVAEALEKLALDSDNKLLNTRSDVPDAVVGI